MGLNLLPNEARFQLEKMKFNKLVLRLVVAIAAGWTVVVLVIMSIYWANRIKKEKAEKTFNSLNGQYMSMSDGVVVNQRLRQKLKLASEILDKRFEYGQMFKTIDSLFGDEVRMTDMKMKADKTYILSGEVGSGEVMDAVEKKIMDINEGVVENVTGAEIDQVVNRGGIWSFRLTVKLT